MSAAAGDRVLVAAAAVQLGQVLRAGRARGRSVMLAAAYRVAPAEPDGGPPQELSLCGTLLVQAALAAAREQGDDRAAGRPVGRGCGMAARVGDGHDHHRTGFGPAAVERGGITAAVELGDAGGGRLAREVAGGTGGGGCRSNTGPPTWSTRRARTC